MTSENPFQLSSLPFPNDKSKKSSQREPYKEQFAQKKYLVLHVLLNK